MNWRRLLSRDTAIAVGLSLMLAGTVWLVTVKAIEALTGAASQ